MLSESNNFYIQKSAGFRKHEKIYSIVSDQEEIGNLRKTHESSIKQRVVSLFSPLLLSGTSVVIKGFVLELLDREDNLLGKIEKRVGLENDLSLYDRNDAHIATVQPTVKVKAPAIHLIDKKGKVLLHAKGRSGAADFTVANGKNKQVSSIKKRSLIYPTVKENLLHHDVYHIDNSNREDIITFGLIGIATDDDSWFLQI